MNYTVTNSGGMRTIGWEASVQARAIDHKTFKWDVGFNIAQYKSTITKMPAGAILTDFADGTIITEEGSAPNLFYGFKKAGIYSTEAEAAAAAVPATLASATAPKPAAGRKDEVTVTLRPDQAAEVKLVMRAGARANFRWSVKGGHVNYDTHGDPMDNPNGYHGYSKGRQSTGDAGVLEAAFDGRHGWYWRNRSGAEVTVTLQTEGDYQEIKQLL